jgi:hypothetical protein
MSARRPDSSFSAFAAGTSPGVPDPANRAERAVLPGLEFPTQHESNAEATEGGDLRLFATIVADVLDQIVDWMLLVPS